MFDIQLVFDTYIASLDSEVNSVRQVLEEYTGSLEEEVAQCNEQEK